MHFVKFLVQLICIISWISLFPAVLAAEKDSSIIGRVVWAKGHLQAFQPDAAVRNLKRSDPIYAKDTLITDAATTGEIVFTDNSLLSLRENTTLQITSYKFTDATAKNNSFIVNVIKGGFRTITGAISKSARENYQAKTPVATIGVLGTQYSLYYAPGSKGLAAKLDHGAIVIKNKAGVITLTNCDHPSNTCVNNIYARVASEIQPPKVIAQKPVEFNQEVPLTATSYQGAPIVEPPQTTNADQGAPIVETPQTTNADQGATIVETPQTTNAGEDCAACKQGGLGAAAIPTGGVVSSFCIK